jgi:hypothetical protein
MLAKASNRLDINILEPRTNGGLAIRRRGDLHWRSDIANNVRFTPESGHVRCNSLRLLWAISGHPASAIAPVMAASVASRCGV